MKHNIYRMALGLTIAAIGASASAQNTASGYFVEDFTYRYMMNPAMGNSRGFVSMPALGDFNLGLRCNLNVDNILYNVDGRTTTFMNPKISAKEAMSKFGDKNRLGLTNRLTILAIGFKGFRGYNTISLGVRSDVEVQFPRALMSLMKEGISNTTYDISDFRVFGRAYGEVALNHSHQIGKNLRIGVTGKVLVGGGNIEANFRNANLHLGKDSWSIQSEAVVNANIKGFTFDKDINDRTGKYYVNGGNIDGAGINGLGFAVDLGAVYTTPVKGLTVSAALTDLGFINWKNNMLATTNGVKKFDTAKYTFPLEDKGDYTFSDEWDAMEDDISALYELEDMGDQGSQRTALHATMNIGASYEFPFYRKLTFGLLNTTRLAGNYSWSEFRLSANIAPFKAFSCGVNTSTGTFGTSLGWLFNIHAPGFNLFAGMDHMPTKLSKQGVPLSSTADFTLGFNFLIK